MATKSLGQLTLDLIARIGGYVAPLDQAARKSKDTGKKIKDSAKEASDAWGSLGKAVSGLFVGVSVGAVFTRFIQETKAAEQEQAQLAAVLKSTGNAAGFTQDELNKMADSMEGITAFSGGEFTEAQTTLLAFTGIVGEQVPRALMAAADMAARTGNSVKGSAELIGRALDVPSKGLAALSKQGFRFSEDQKKLIERLEQTGRTAEAQGIILDALEQTYGGAAEAARDTFGGALAALNNTIDGLLTGEGSLDSARDAIESLNGLLSDPKTREGIDQLTSGLVTAGGKLVEFLSGAANYTAWFGETVAAYINGINGDDIDRLEARSKQIQASMGGIWSAFTAGGNSDLFASNEELKKELELVNKMIADYYERQSMIEKKSPAAPASSAPSAGKQPIFQEYNIENILSDMDAVTNKQIDSYKKIQSAYQSQEDSYRRQLKLTGEVTEAQRLQFEIANGSLVGINSKQAEYLEGMAKQIDAAKQLAENEKLVSDLRKEFQSISEEALESSGKLIDLENYRSEKQREDLQKQMDELKAKGAWTAEIEAESQKALEEQEQAHQDRLKKIREQAEADEVKRRQIQLAGAESLFGALGDLTEAFGEKNSRLRKAFLIAEKASAIASATIAIQKGIAEASTLSFPANLVAMGTVAAQTAGILTTIKGVNVAHGGLDFVPKEQTYLLDKGERVVSPKQNTDLTNFLANAKASSGMRVEVINNATNVPMAANASMVDENTLRIVLTAVDARLKEDLNNGRGVWRQAEGRYGLAVKGAY